jgi:nuclear protein NHN1
MAFQGFSIAFTFISWEYICGSWAAKQSSSYQFPFTEPKEPVRMTLPKTDKLIKPAKEITSTRNSAADNSKSPAKPAAPVPAKPTPPVVEPAPKKKSASSRREELLKQLKAVEDAIARKRTK